jgi:hypothetical protein
MDKINELFECQIGDAINAFPSVFSKDDVVDILSKLRTNVLYAANEIKSNVGITEEQFQEFNANVRDALERVLYDSDQIVDTHSAEFSIDYDNRISVENISVNADFVTEELDEIMLDRFQEAFGELIIKNETTI